MSPGPGLEQTYDCWAAAASPAQGKARACSAFGRVTEFHSFLIAKRCLLVIVAAEVLFKFPIYPNLDAAEGKGKGPDLHLAVLWSLGYADPAAREGQQKLRTASAIAGGPRRGLLASDSNTSLGCITLPALGGNGLSVRHPGVYQLEPSLCNLTPVV